MSIYFTDIVQITPITRDTNFRNKTEGTPFYSEAYVKEDDKIIYGSDGMPIKPARKIFLPYNVSIKKGDFIKLTSKSNYLVTDTNRLVKAVAPIGSFKRDHLKVLV